MPRPRPRPGGYAGGGGGGKRGDAPTSGDGGIGCRVRLPVVGPVIGVSGCGVSTNRFCTPNPE